MLEDAWAAWCDDLKAAGARILAQPLTDGDRAEGLRWLTRLMRYGLEAGVEFSDPAFPAFFMPTHKTVKIMSDNPDAMHFMAPVQGDCEYVLSGERGTNARIMFTVLGRTPEGKMVQLSGLDSSELKLGTDNRFTIYLSRERKGDNWLPLPANAASVLARALFIERDKEVPPTLRLDPAATGGMPPALEPESLARKLAMARQITLGSFGNIQAYGEEMRAAGWINRFGENPRAWAAGDPGVHYWHGTWKLDMDEGLLVEIDPPKCFFWNFQVNNRWAESLDYLHRRIHLNAATAVREPDGKVRAIIARRDPGLPNWLDASDHEEGLMLIRTMDGEAPPVVNTQVIRLDR